MSVYEHEPKFYVQVEFVGNLDEIEIGGIAGFLTTYGYETHLVTDSLTVDGFEDEHDAGIFLEKFTEKFNHLIK